jgi:hypothetical protein
VGAYSANDPATHLTKSGALVKIRTYPCLPSNVEGQPFLRNVKAVAPRWHYCRNSLCEQRCRIDLGSILVPRPTQAQLKFFFSSFQGSLFPNSVVPKPRWGWHALTEGAFRYATARGSQRLSTQRIQKGLVRARDLTSTSFNSTCGSCCAALLEARRGPAYHTAFSSSACERFTCLKHHVKYRSGHRSYDSCPPDSPAAWSS